MALSPAHRFGQIIGEALERALDPLLTDFAARHGLFLDRHGSRLARRGAKVTWVDRSGNAHDLDFVLERGGTGNLVGQPIAFIETAWRRYTKHSRNKAQEIQGAILPLAESFRECSPFVGVVLAGEFTEGALQQLRSVGFQVIHFPYESIVAAFAAAGIDAQFDENTPDREFARKVARWNRLSPVRQANVGRKLVEQNAAALREFFGRLESSVTRRLDYIAVIPLYGSERRCASVAEAIAFLNEPEGSRTKELQLRGFDIVIRYTSGDHIEARFVSAEAASEFLRKF